MSQAAEQALRKAQKAHRNAPHGYKRARWNDLQRAMTRALSERDPVDVDAQRNAEEA